MKDGVIVLMIIIVGVTMSNIDNFTKINDAISALDTINQVEHTFNCYEINGHQLQHIVTDARMALAEIIKLGDK